MLIVFSLIFVVNTKILFGYNFVAPLKKDLLRHDIYVFRHQLNLLELLWRIRLWQNLIKRRYNKHYFIKIWLEIYFQTFSCFMLNNLGLILDMTMKNDNRTESAKINFWKVLLTLSWRRSLSYRNQFIAFAEQINGLVFIW